MAKLPGDLEKGMRIVCCAHNLMPSFGQACAKSRSGRNVSDCLLHLSWTKAKKSWVKAKKKWAVDAVYWAVDAEMASFSITMRSWVKKRKWASGEGEGEGLGPFSQIGRTGRMSNYVHSTCVLPWSTLLKRCAGKYLNHTVLRVYNVSS